MRIPSSPLLTLVLVLLAPIARARAGGADSLAATDPPAASGLAFTRIASQSEVDANGDGLAEALAVVLDVEITKGGLYTIRGTLREGEELVANRPRFESALSTSVSLDRGPGAHSVTLEFSGEQIFRSGSDGPYDLHLLAAGGTTAAVAKLATGPVDHARFGEVGAALVSVSERAADSDADGRPDAIELRVQLCVRAAGDYRLQAELSKGGTSLAGAGLRATLARGSPVMKVLVPGRRIRSAGVDGPYDGILELLDAEARPLGSMRFTTSGHIAASFTS